jgi:hypothetical protein
MVPYASIEVEMPSTVTFNAFVVSLATTAAVHFGDVANASSSNERPTANLEAAGHAIEMLTVLEQKTRGNLTEEEKSFLAQVLYELRVRYVELEKESQV